MTYNPNEPDRNGIGAGTIGAFAIAGLLLLGALIYAVSSDRTNNAGSSDSATATVERNSSTTGQGGTSK